jgi:hypothetical protein
MAAPSPATAHHRARVGALSRDRQPNDPEFLAAKRDLAAANIEDYITRVISAAPPLTAEQRTRLAELLRPIRLCPGGDAA